ncbi:MAG: hypothetical protein ACRDHG_08720 [Anaerolineales bacterium]
MLTKTCLTVQDLQELLSGIWEYNQRGPVVALRCFAEDGVPCDVAWIEVVSEDAGLRVRTRPELTSEQVVALATAGIDHGDR